jgi:IMP dehydrogenase/GMP reductase
MKIEEGIKYDYSNVLIKPQRSTLGSRIQVDLTREIKFKYSKRTWTGVPIIVANMDTTGTIEMALEMQKHKIITCLHKYYTATDITNATLLDKDYFMVTIGILNTPEQWDEFVNLMEIVKPHFLCIDVANGYSALFVEFGKKVRLAFPNVTLVGGNVVTREMVQELSIYCQFDIIKIGIGSGCFSADTKVLMANGTYKNINTIIPGESVINREGKPVKVLNVTCQGEKRVLKIRTNNWHTDTIVTPDHRYWIGDLQTSSLECINTSGIETPKSSKYKWQSIGNVNPENTFLLMPNKFKWQLPENFKIDLSEYTVKSNVTDESIITTGNGTIEINRHVESCYDLGYIFGTFLGDGNSRITNQSGQSESGSCHWAFGLHEQDIADKLIAAISNMIQYDCYVDKPNNKNILLVSCYNKCFAKLFNEFGKRLEKHLPEKYYCTNKKYIQGLFDGLIDSDGSIDINKSGSENLILNNTNEKIIELFNWCCFNLEYSFGSGKTKKSIGNLKGTCIENLQQGYRVKTHTLNRFTNDYVYSTLLDSETNGVCETWDIEVDCPTHSFIANNSIVHNSVCTTRLQTGVGYPQLSAVMECSDAAHGLGTHIIGDGGITNAGDLAKCLGGGADFVMAGGLFAGHDESGGELVIDPIDNKKYKLFYGMSSATAMNKHAGGVAHYRSAEGKTVKLPYKGPVSETVKHLLGGLRSACTYIGAEKIKHMSLCTTFLLVNNQVNQIFKD